MTHPLAALNRLAWTTGLLFSAALHVACSPATDPMIAGTEPRPTPLAAELPHAVLPNGFSVTLELAITPEETAVGLMYRPSLPGDRGMLLLFGDERLPSIWMKNTLIALDLVFLDRFGTVVKVVQSAPPCKADPCPVYMPEAPARAVLELVAGAASRHGIGKGSTVQILDVEGYPEERDTDE